MDVSCPQCDTLYEFDRRQARGAGVTLKCSQCGYTFRLGSKQEIRDESQRRWMVRQAQSGDVLYFATFDILHQWIMDGSIGAQDSISRTGRSWTQLGDIGEFTPIFQVVASIAEFTAAADKTKQDGDDEAPAMEGGSGTDPRFRARQQMSTPAPAPSSRQPSRQSSPTPSPRQPTRESSPTPSPRQPTQESAPAPAPTQQPRRRKQTTPQFRGVSSESPAAERGQGSSPGTRRPPRRAMQSTMPGKPGGIESSQPPPGRRPTPTPMPAAAESSAPGEQRNINLQDRRLQSDLPSEGIRKQAREPLVADEEGPTFGELEFGGGTDSEILEFERPRRRWPLVAVLLVALAVGAAVWQRDALEDLVANMGDGEQEHVAAVDDEPHEELGDPLFGEARRAVDHSLDRAVVAQRGELVAAAIGEARPAVEQSRADGEDAARRAVQPTVGELIAAGRRSIDRGNPEQALERFEFALQESPDNTEALIGLGWANLSAGSPDVAVRHFNRVLQLDRAEGEALIGLGRAERERGRPEQALQAYDEYLERFPNGSHASIARYQGELLRRSLDN